MTISQIREARSKAEEQIGQILLALTQRTGLQVYEVNVHTTVFHSIESRYAQAVDVRTTIKLEGP